MPNITITNVSSEPVNLRDLYFTLPPGQSYTGYRDSAALMASADLQSEIASGTVTFDFVFTADESAADFIPFPGMVSVSSILIFADDGNVAANPRYLRPGTGTASATEFQIHMPRAGTARNLHVNLGSAPGIGHSVTVTVRRNGVNTPLQVTIADANTHADNHLNNVVFAGNDNLSVLVTPSGPNDGSDISATLEY